MDIAPGRVVVDAPAKLNLTLEVMDRRPDGYHEIETIMQAIDLFDRLTVEVGPGDALEVTTSDPGLPIGLDNLAGRAAALLLVALDQRAAVRIAIDKRIPAAAGLGGGSSDAAATLAALNHLLGRPLGAARLLGLAARLGADVSFFLAGGTCFAWGRGERLARLPGLRRAAFVVVAADCAVKSRWAYNYLEQMGLTPSRGGTRMLAAAVRSGQFGSGLPHLTNHLEPAVVSKHPELRDNRQELIDAGARAALMTGSGSAVFGVAEDRRGAEMVAAALRTAKRSVFVAGPIDSGVVLRGVD